MIAQFERFQIEMTLQQALDCSHAGRCDEDVAATVPTLEAQLQFIGPEPIRAELKEYGAWDAEELADDEMNRQRIVWCAACNIREETRT